MSLSTHILDTALGRPAPGVALTLEQLHGTTWTPLFAGQTDRDGRCRLDVALRAATYRLRFQTAPYFAAQGLLSLYPYVEIAFTIADPAQHHHIPLLLTANGYTTYRGS